MFKALVAGTTLAAGMKCPGSVARLHHASCQTTATFEKGSCDAVIAEIKARIAGENGWKDPHNGGTYTLEAGSTETELNIQRTTGGGKYTDKMIFSLEKIGNLDEGCKLEACSESQVFSIMDFGTNFCNLHDLYCGTQDGCPFSIAEGGDLAYTEEVGSCTKADKPTCVAKKAEEVEVAAAQCREEDDYCIEQDCCAGLTCITVEIENPSGPPLQMGACSEVVEVKDTPQIV